MGQRELESVVESLTDLLKKKKQRVIDLS